MIVSDRTMDALVKSFQTIEQACAKIADLQAKLAEVELERDEESGRRRKYEEMVVGLNFEITCLKEAKEIADATKDKKVAEVEDIVSGLIDHGQGVNWDGHKRVDGDDVAEKQNVALLVKKAEQSKEGGKEKCYCSIGGAGPPIMCKRCRIRVAQSKGEKTCNNCACNTSGMVCTAGGMVECGTDLVNWQSREGGDV